MKTCAKCGRLNEDSAKFCDSCGASLATSGSPSYAPSSPSNPPTPSPEASVPRAGYGLSPGAPPTASPPSAPPPAPPSPPPLPPYVIADPSRPGARRPFGYRHRRRTNASILLTLGFVLSAIALGTAWWSISSGTTSQYYTPGQTYSCIGTGCAQTFYSYTNSISAQMGTLYGAIEYMVIGAVLLAIIAALFAFFGAYGVTYGRGQLQMVVLFSVLAGILLAASVIYVAVAQPSALQASTAGCNGPSYCTSFFFGSYTAGGVTSSYGPSVGWFAALIGFLLLIIGAVGYSRTRVEPFTMEELAASRELPVGGPAAQAPFPPSVAPMAGAPAELPPPVMCPRCGALNANTAPTCWRCQAPMR